MYKDVQGRFRSVGSKITFKLPIRLANLVRTRSLSEKDSSSETGETLSLLCFIPAYLFVLLTLHLASLLPPY
jgi:hypothetical protein